VSEFERKWFIRLEARRLCRHGFVRRMDCDECRHMIYKRLKEEIARHKK